jgi:hypothetical protein
MDNILEEAKRRYKKDDKFHPICPHTKRILWIKYLKYIMANLDSNTEEMD